MSQTESPQTTPIQRLHKTEEVTLKRHIEKQSLDLGLGLKPKAITAQMKVLLRAHPNNGEASLTAAIAAADEWLATQRPAPQQARPARQPQLAPATPVETPRAAPLTLAERIGAQARAANAPVSPIVVPRPLTLEQEFPDYTPKARVICKMFKTPVDFNSQSGYEAFDLVIRDLQDVVTYIKEMGFEPFIAKASRRGDQQTWQLKSVVGGKIQRSRSDKAATFHVNISSQLEEELEHFARLNGLEIIWPEGTGPAQQASVIGAGHVRK